MHTHCPRVLLASVTPYEAHVFTSIQNLIINLMTLIIFFISQILSVLSHVSILNLEPLGTVQLPYLPFVPLVLSQGPTISSMKDMCMLSHSSLSLCDPMNCSQPGSSAHRILQGRILEWIAISFQGIFLTHRSNLHLLHLLHWQVDSLPLSYQGSLCTVIFTTKKKNSHINGPAQFKPMLFKGQLHFSCLFYTIN